MMLGVKDWLESAPKVNSESCSCGSILSSEDPGVVLRRFFLSVGLANSACDGGCSDFEAGLRSNENGYSLDGEACGS